MLRETAHYASALTLTLAGAASAQQSPLDQQTLYGINSTDAQLVRYDFSEGELTSVGPIRTAQGATLYGIEGAAYVPGFQNLFAFWLDPSDYTCKMVYVDVTEAKATIVADDMEGGRITGATAFSADGGDWRVYATQEAAVTPPFSVKGKANINPNNSNHMEFELRRPHGPTITRDHLHKSSPINGSGTYYQGEANYVRIRPKGNGNQNGLIINGDPYPLKNSNTYILVGEMDVRVYNDHPHNGKAMGHWWIEIIDGTANWEGDLEVTTPDRLVMIDHHTGEVTELFPTERAYDSLATFDGQTFYATDESRLYQLDPASETETLVGTLRTQHNRGMEAVNEATMVYETVNDTLRQVDHQTAGEMDLPRSIDAMDLGTIVFVGHAKDRWGKPVSFD